MIKDNVIHLTQVRKQNEELKTKQTHKQNKASNYRPIRVLSLFSGIGAFEKALKNKNIPFELVNYCEIDDSASLSYSLIQNEPESKNWWDVTSMINEYLPAVDLMTYGFPCQSFSLAGSREGFLSKTNGTLFNKSAIIAHQQQPKYLIAENVVGLVNHDEGRTFQIILETLDKIGYNNYYKILTSSDFGIPQARDRIFIVSIRKDVDLGRFKFPVGEKTTKTVDDFLDHSIPIEDRIIKRTMRPFLNTKFHKEVRGSSGLIKLFDGVRQGYFSGGFYANRIFSTKGFCPTLMTKAEGPYFQEIKGEPTPKERLRLQGFTDEDYNKIKDHVTGTQISKQAGNSITVQVLEAVISNLLEAQNELPHNQYLQNKFTRTKFTYKIKDKKPRKIESSSIQCKYKKKEDDNMNKINWFRGNYSFLSNFYESPLTIGGITYSHSESAFQAMKTFNQRERLKFRNITPTQAKRLGRKITLRPDWEEVKVKVMYFVVKEKFKQNIELQNLLLATENIYLEEGNNWNDRTWGTVNGIGSNYLGRILMQVRQELRAQNQVSTAEQEAAITSSEQ